MCHVLSIERIGFYAWLKRPLSAKAKDDRRLLGKIKQFWVESGCTYGYRNITIDLKSDGESCGKNRVYGLMRQASIRAVRGYKRHSGFKGGKTNTAAHNSLVRAFEVDKPGSCWITDFTYIRTYEDWLNVTTAFDLFPRKVVGRTMKDNPKAVLVIDALLNCLTLVPNYIL